MVIRTVVVETEVPEDIYQTLQAHGLYRDTLARQSRGLLAIRFYQDRVLSLGKAARLAGLNRWEFVDLLADNNVAVVDYTDEELATEFANAEQLATELQE